MKYQPVPFPDKIFKTINETDKFATKIQIYQFDNDCFTAQDNYLDNTEDKGQIRSNDDDNSEDKVYHDLDSSK